MRLFRFGPKAILIACLVLSGTVGAAPPKQPRVHVVYSGQTLGMIARRYNVSINAICRANGITRSTPIKPKQRLVIPDRDDKDGSRAATAKEKAVAPKQNSPRKPSDKQSKTDRASNKEPATVQARAASKVPQRKTSGAETKYRAETTWQRYARPARRPGYIVLRGTMGKWQGYAIVKGGRVSGSGRRGFKKILASWRTGASRDVDMRLIRLVVQVSDKFGGRPLHVVSGYREKSFARESKHKFGRAIDFSIEGVPNEALRDYLRTLPNVGVGYYPNSSFVHLDVRERSAFWVDYAKPGAPPRYAHKRATRAPKQTEKPVSPASPPETKSEGSASGEQGETGARPPNASE